MISLLFLLTSTGSLVYADEPGVTEPLPPRGSQESPFKIQSFMSAVQAVESNGLVVEDLNTLTPEDITKVLLGTNVQASSIQYKGALQGAGTFSGGSDIIGFDSGVILSCGSVDNVIGPNEEDGISSSNGVSGDKDLSGLINNENTNDASVLEFDFIPQGDVISFMYVFGSDEYNEYVYSYNDVFGFFLNGQNIALLPGTNIPVSINNVNGGKPYGQNSRNPQYFRNNDVSDGGGSINTEMDGLTTVLSVQASVIPNEVNHIKLAVADAGDSSLDSVVFIKAGSFNDKPIEYGQFNLSQSYYTVAENVQGGVASFTVDRYKGSNGTVLIEYSTFDGTALAGSDYQATKGVLTFADGETTKTFTVPIIDDKTIEEKEETLTVKLAFPQEEPQEPQEPQPTIVASLKTPLGTTLGATLGEVSSATLTIIDDDSTVVQEPGGFTWGSPVDSCISKIPEILFGYKSTWNFIPDFENLPSGAIIDRWPNYIPLSKPVKLFESKSDIILDFDAAILAQNPKHNARVYYWNDTNKKWVALATYPSGEGKVKAINDGNYKGWFCIFGVIQPTFTDLDGNVYEQLINRLNGLGIIEGYENGENNQMRVAKPEQFITKLEYSILIERLLSINPDNDTLKDYNKDDSRKIIKERFEDADTIPDWASSIVAAIVDKGLIADDDVNFNTNSPITKEEASAMLNKALKIAPNYKMLDMNNMKNLSDLPEWAKAALADNPNSTPEVVVLDLNKEISRGEALKALNYLFIISLGW
jgi:hypothetical protein